MATLDEVHKAVVGISDLLSGNISAITRLEGELGAVQNDLERLKRMPTALAWVLLSDVLLSTSRATINFPNLPNTYQHLRIVGAIRTDYADVTDGIKINVNGDTGNFYDWMYADLRYGGAPAGTSVWYTLDGQGTGYAELGFFPAGNAPDEVFGLVDLSIPHYSSSLMRKVWSMTGGHLNAFASQNIFYNVAFGMYNVSPPLPISRIEFTPVFGSNFVAGTRLTIYGLGR